MNIIMIDDEQMALELLEGQLKKIRSDLTIHKFTVFDIHEQRQLLLDADLLFLDIEMPQINGLELLSLISEINPRLQIVFVTAYNEYAIQAFEMNALDYLMKPVQINRLKITMERISAIEKPVKQNNTLQLKLCNEFQIETDNMQYTAIKWRTAKAEELFLYLLHHKGNTIRKEEILEMLWGDTNNERASAQLYTTIYYIRKNILPYSEHFTIKSVQNGYQLLTSNIKTDIYEWESQALSAPAVNRDTINLHERIMRLYTGDYLESRTYPWAEGERFRLAQIWVDRARNIASYFINEDNIEKAVYWLDKIVNMRPEDEHASFLLMKIYAELIMDCCKLSIRTVEASIKGARCSNSVKNNDLV